MNIKQIKSLADEGQYGEALAECENLLESEPDNKADILRARAYIFGLQDDYAQALRDREMVLAIGNATLQDYYRAADNALYAGELEKSIQWLNEVLRLGEELSETWFESAAYLLLAYAYMELGNYSEAISNADSAAKVEADCAMPLPEVGMCSVEQLKKEIMRRAR